MRKRVYTKNAESSPAIRREGGGMSGGGVERVEVMDLYLACYYVLRGCEVAAVKCIPTGRDCRCELVVQGDAGLVQAIQDEFFHNRATVNLLAFRDAYNQVNGCIRQAKKSYEMAKKRVGGVL